jgi:glyoxylase-like metal-dependent hydrolase (beta-lactamase superfamily II)
VISHHHFDHTSGLAAVVAEGITIVTPQVNKSFLEGALSAGSAGLYGVTRGGAGACPLCRRSPLVVFSCASSTSDSMQRPFVSPARHR